MVAAQCIIGDTIKSRTGLLHLAQSITGDTYKNSYRLRENKTQTDAVFKDF
jgi:hypothetical protein